MYQKKVFLEVQEVRRQGDLATKGCFYATLAQKTLKHTNFFCDLLIWEAKRQREISAEYVIFFKFNEFFLTRSYLDLLQNCFEILVFREVRFLLGFQLVSLSELVWTWISARFQIFNDPPKCKIIYLKDFLLIFFCCHKASKHKWLRNEKNSFDYFLKVLFQ